MRLGLQFTLVLALSAGLLVHADGDGTSARRKKKPAQTHNKSLHDQFTGQAWGMAGCGLGSVVFADKPGMVQVVAATLNSTFGNQTFGISSGTSNCGDSGANQEKAMLFIDVNRKALARDVSRGNGETLDSFAKLIGCDSARLAPELKSNYVPIFEDSTDTDATTSAIFNVIRANPGLSQCSTLGLG